MGKSFAAKSKSLRSLRVFMERFPYFERMQADDAQYDDIRFRKLVDKLHTFRQIVVTSDKELDAVNELVKKFNYTGEVRFPTKLDPILKSTLHRVATEKGLKVSTGQRPPAAAKSD